MIYIVIFFLTILFAMLPSLAHATIMANKFYKLDLGNANTTAGLTQDKNYKLGTMVGESPVGIFNEAQYKVTAGFFFGSKKKNPFTFTLSPLLISYGPLSSTTPVVRTAKIAVTNESASGFSVLGFTDHVLQTKEGASIPHVSCDDGRCTSKKASYWQSTLTYGFGFRCDGKLCQSDFQNKNSFLPFADESRTESPQTIFSAKRGKDQNVTITLKVNTSREQSPGPYLNTITFIAIPTL
ncbi:MAG: hypothetical protein HY429_02455 [Candidatus Levybacteria bacterium]|nr:hypothetical protein [Candidatus Levybacteria bacterium]